MPLSPHTPPGTHIVVTWMEKNGKDVLELIAPQYRDIAAKLYSQWYSRDGFSLGDKLVLSRIVFHPISLDGYAAEVVGFKGCYPLKYFDVASLPKSITSLLVSKPVDEVV